jgi:hypothetical protein
MTLWQILRGLAGRDAGRWCRGCGESIRQDDAFGTSEGVCRPCRTAHH